MAAGIAFNLAVLGWFKYRGFFLANWGAEPVAAMALPLGISFYTFQKIAFLADIRRGHIREVSLSKYIAFVMFFPQLIVGPIVKFDQIADQFRRLDHRRIAPDLVVGLVILTQGLFKKIVLADNVGSLADHVFAAAAGREMTLIEGWIGALAFSFQIYFDFSACSDMAIGLARMVGIRLPINFFSRPIRPPALSNSGGAGTSPCRAFCAITFTSRWAATGKVQGGAMSI